MEWTSEDVCDINMDSETDSVLASPLELDFETTEVPQLQLDDDQFITDSNDWTSSQSIFQTYSDRPERILTQEPIDYEINPIVVDPMLAIPPPSPLPFGDTANVKHQIKVAELILDYEEEPNPELEYVFEEEPNPELEYLYAEELISEIGSPDKAASNLSSEDRSCLQSLDLVRPSNDAEVQLPIEPQASTSKDQGNGQLEDRAEKEAQQDGNIKYPKPPYSYACLIVMALKNSEDGALPVAKIYSFICTHFPYFKTAPNGWKNSIRHNLSLNKSFEKIDPSAANKRGGLWTMNPLKVEKMDLELQELSQRDLLAIKRSMTFPDLLELLERGELKHNVELSGGSGDELATNSVTDGYNDSIHEVDVVAGDVFWGNDLVREDHDYLGCDSTMRSRYVSQPVQEKEPMNFGASDPLFEFE